MQNEDFSILVFHFPGRIAMIECSIFLILLSLTLKIRKVVRETAIAITGTLQNIVIRDQKNILWEIVKILSAKGSRNVPLREVAPNFLAAQPSNPSAIQAIT